MKFVIIAADRVIDGVGDHSGTNKIIAKAEKLNLKCSVLEVVSLAKRWEDKLRSDQFKSGASAMAAIDRARKLLKSGKTSVVMIRGEDFLKTGVSREDRDKFMKLYKKKYTPLDGYNKLVLPFLKHHKISEKDYFTVRDALFDNYTRTWEKLNPHNHVPDERWFGSLTKYFRGVDCANPNIDYSGQLIITTEATADVLKIPKRERIGIIGNAFTKLQVDGFESIPKIAPYEHLRKTINKTLKEASVDFNSEFLQGRALLETYTCYPVVPMALLLKLGLVVNFNDIPKLLQKFEVTVTGGLNLAKAPWNLTSLNYLIAMREKLMNCKEYKLGLVHGNGSLGNQQGITIISKDY